MLPKVDEAACNGFLGQVFREHFRLLYHCADRLLLLVWRVAMPAQSSPYQPPQVGARTFAQSPINADVITDGFHQLTCDHPELLVSQNLYSTVVSCQGIVEGQFIIREAQQFTAGVGFAHLMGQLD